MLPYLVSIGKKPVASIVLGTNMQKCNIELKKIYIYDNCCSYIIYNRWNVYVLMICQKNKYNKFELEELANETIPYIKIGKIYGYL